MKRFIDFFAFPVKLGENSKEWPQILAVLSAALSSLNLGILFTWPSPAIPKLLLSDEYDFDIVEASYLTIIPPIAMIIASPVYCKLIDTLGRKMTLLTSTFLYAASWLLIAFAKEIYVFYISRVLTGMADASVYATLPIYIAEVATPKVRGLWGNSIMFFMFTGQLIINSVGYYCSIPLTAFLMLVFPLFFFLTFVLMPETPYYHIMKNNPSAARSSLKRLRGVKNVEAELEQLTTDVQRQLSERGSLTDLFVIRSNRRAVFICNLARLSQQFGGISALAVYTQYIFLQTGGNISSGHSSMIFAGALAIVNSFGTVVSDKLGRSKAMVISCVGCGVTLLAESVYFYLLTETNVDVTYVTWFPVLGLFIYVLVFTVGLSIVPALLIGELFSTSIRAQASLVANVVFAVLISVVTKLFQFLMSEYGLWVPFLFFALCCFLSAISSYFFIPDTKGKTLEQIQQMLKGI